MLSERKILAELSAGKLSFPPLSFRLVQQPQPETDSNRRFDAFIEAAWNDRTARFAVECMSISTPRAFQAGLDRLKAASFPNGYLPMLIMPFLGENQLRELERAGVSGIDLSGNGIVVVPDTFAVLRGGGKNRFPSSAPIKNVYRLNSSMVGGVFLSHPDYGSVQEVWMEVNRRNMLVNRGLKTPMSLSTVSKVLKALEDDLIIERTAGIRLMQADILLEKLWANATPPKTGETIRLRIPDEQGPVIEMLAHISREAEVPWVMTGLSSVRRYAVMQRSDLLSVYCPRLKDMTDFLPPARSDRFANIEIIETEDETAYFDTRPDQNIMWAPPLRTYLELMAGDKRDRETAEQVGAFIISGVKSMRSER